MSMCNKYKNELPHILFFLLLFLSLFVIGGDALLYAHEYLNYVFGMYYGQYYMGV